MIEFLPLLNINMPPFIAEIFRTLSISSFDFLPVEDILAKLNDNSTDKAFSDNFAYQGYETTYFIHNIPDIIIIEIVMLFLIPNFLLIQRLTNPDSLYSFYLIFSLNVYISKKL